MSSDDTDEMRATRRDVNKAAGVAAAYPLSHATSEDESLIPDFIRFWDDEEETVEGEFWSETNGHLEPSDGQPVNVPELFSGSLPTLVRLERVDSSTARAYDREQHTLIDEGTHATVIQSAIDHVRSNYGTDVSNSSYPALHDVRSVGAIDGGHETFICDTQIQLKDQVKLKNVDLDFNGNTLDGIFGFGFGIAAQPDGDNMFIENIQLESVTVRNVGGGGGCRLKHPAWGVIDNCTFKDNGGNGFVLVGAVGMLSRRCRYTNNDGAGAQRNDTSDIDGNFNAWEWCDFFNNSGVGLSLRKTNVTSDESDIFIIHRCNVQANDSGGSNTGIQLGENIRTAVITENWFESSQVLEVGASGACDLPYIARNKIQDLQVTNSARARLEGNFTESGSTLSITIGSNSTDTRLRNNFLSGGSVTDNGARTRRNGLGQTSGSPTASNWDPGDLVRDTTNATTYLILHDNSSVTI